MPRDVDIPRFVPIVAGTLGCFDLFRASMHTVFLGYASRNVAGLDVDGPAGADLLQLMAAFGASNIITGGALIAVALTSRRAALALLGLMPVAYLVAIAALGAAMAGLDASQANWGGAPVIKVYLAVSALVFVAGYMVARRNRAARKAGG